MARLVFKMVGEEITNHGVINLFEPFTQAFNLCIIINYCSDDYTNNDNCNSNAPPNVIDLLLVLRSAILIIVMGLFTKFTPTIFSVRIVRSRLCHSFSLNLKLVL